MLLCKDCKYRVGYYCHRPELSLIDYITGEIDAWVCNHNRRDKNICGPDAKHFVKKDPWWKRLFK